MKRNIIIVVVAVLIAIPATVGTVRVYNVVSALNQIDYYQICKALLIPDILESKDNAIGRLEISKPLLRFYALRLRGADKKDVDEFRGGMGLYEILNYKDAPSTDKNALVERLIKGGYDINRRDDYGLTALHHAITINKVKHVDYLLSKGADTRLPVTRQNFDGENIVERSPIEYATEISKRDDLDRSAIIALLEKHKGK